MRSLSPFIAFNAVKSVKKKNDDVNVSGQDFGKVGEWQTISDAFILFF